MCPEIVSGAAMAACEPAGQRADGQPCGADVQCTSAYCRRSLGHCGVCTARLPKGAKCTPGIDDQCQRGLVCPASGVCVAPGGMNDACNPQTRPCLPHLRCASGICLAPLAAGASCSGDDCNQLLGLWCNKPGGAMRGTCQAAKVGNKLAGPVGRLVKWRYVVPYTVLNLPRALAYRRGWMGRNRA